MNLRGFFFLNFFSSETGGGGEVTVGQYTVESTRDRPGIRYTNVRDPLKHLRCQFKNPLREITGVNGKEIRH